MATVFFTRFHTGRLGQIIDLLSHHRLKTFLVLLASGTLAGALGVILLAALIQNGSPRMFVMLFPHAFASTFAFMLFLAAVFAQEEHGNA